MFLGCKSIEFRLQKHCYEPSKAMLLADTYPHLLIEKKKAALHFLKKKQ